jgi:cation diffusion facilitator CzcD-associated flavoprotein CzcO
MVKPHPYGCKRVSLENGYYELFNLDRTELVDVNETPIVSFTSTGIKTTTKDYDFDAIIFATGFDAITGGILAMNLTGQGGVSLKDIWAQGVKTFMGISAPDFPNMSAHIIDTSSCYAQLTLNRFFTYGPQAPTALCNGPSCAELQGDWIVNALQYMKDHNISTFNASKERAEKWADLCSTIANTSLLPKAKSVSPLIRRATSAMRDTDGR